MANEPLFIIYVYLTVKKGNLLNSCPKNIDELTTV